MLRYKGTSTTGTVMAEAFSALLMLDLRWRRDLTSCYKAFLNGFELLDGALLIALAAKTSDVFLDLLESGSWLLDHFNLRQVLPATESLRLGGQRQYLGRVKVLDGAWSADLGELIGTLAGSQRLAFKVDQFLLEADLVFFTGFQLDI